MNFNVEFSQTQLTISNNSNDSYSIPLAGSNALVLPNGATVQPPGNSYWHIASVTGGAVLEGTHGPLSMPAGSTATFNVDSL